MNRSLRSRAARACMQAGWCALALGAIAEASAEPIPVNTPRLPARGAAGAAAPAQAGAQATGQSSPYGASPSAASSQYPASQPAGQPAASQYPASTATASQYPASSTAAAQYPATSTAASQYPASQYPSTAAASNPYGTPAQTAGGYGASSPQYGGYSQPAQGGAYGGGGYGGASAQPGSYGAAGAPASALASAAARGAGYGAGNTSSLPPGTLLMPARAEAGACRAQPSPDRQFIALVSGAESLARKQVPLGDYKSQLVVHSPDGRWAVAFTKLRGREQYAAITLDLEQCQMQNTIELPSAGQDVRFEGDEAVLKLGSGERRVGLRDGRIR